MARFQLVCEVGFLERLFNEISALGNDFQDFLQDDTDERLHLTQLYRLLHKNSDVHVDYDDEQLLELARQNPYFKSLLKTNRLTPRPSDFAHLANDEQTYFQSIPSPSTIFLLQKSEVDCQLLEQRYGYVVVSSENIVKVRFLFNFYLQTLTKRNPAYTDWSFIEPFRHPFNAMVIADNYVLKDSTVIKQNLLPFLKRFMPTHLDKNIFQLTILTYDVPNIKQRHIDLSNELSSLFPYPVQLCIVICNKDELHDRNMLTNYFWLSSGFGFSLFKDGKVAKDTHLTVFPIFYPSLLPTPYNVIAPKTLTGQYAVQNMSVSLAGIFKKIHDDRPETLGMVTYVCGKKQNRLLQ